MRLDVADADVPLRDAELLCDPLALSRKPDSGLPGRLGEDLDVRPRDVAPPSGAEDFQDGLLGREASGQVLHLPLVVARAVGLLELGIAAVEEALAVLLDEAPDAGRLNDVDAVSDDGHARYVTVDAPHLTNPAVPPKTQPMNAQLDQLKFDSKGLIPVI